LAGGRDVGGVYNEALIDRQQVLAFDHKLGHWSFLLLDGSNTQSPSTAVEGAPMSGLRAIGRQKIQNDLRSWAMPYIVICKHLFKVVSGNNQ
jgi:hypothetical protein